MTRDVIEFYRIKVLFATTYLIYLLSNNMNSIFTCDIWLVGLIRIIHRIPWIFPIFDEKSQANYQVISIPFSIVFHTALLTRESEYYCETAPDLEFAVYIETYFALTAYGLLLFIALIAQFTYSRKQYIKIKLDSVLFNTINKWNQLDRICCICRDDFTETDQLAQINCGHYDHLNCMQDWIKVCSACPRCKKVIN